MLGIDEAGRGPLAGPVYVGAVLLPVSIRTYPFPLRDSKQMTPRQRKEVLEWIEQSSFLSYTFSYVSAKCIDKEGIVVSVSRAALRCTERMMPKKNNTAVQIITDAGIHVRGYEYTTFPRADETIRAVSLASVVAKEMRDRYIKRMHKKYPQYGFDHHKGYGTPHHQKMIRMHGICDIHRLTFTRKFHTLSKT